MLKRKVDDEPEEFAGLRDSLWRLCEIGEKEKHKNMEKCKNVKKVKKSKKNVNDSKKSGFFPR